ncbi:hypothetical protein FA13DRAFT_1720837 [Coprinellus micaceus]|uniref:Uncharacterized protein n=1 Tax=Coprinellus micaceus TaxID=71717 RepID=A0A4Y7S5K6_COPMI|nr:hypothetical protein FA13DRAFT_1720837 [Coprinellus micaceus]
MTVPQDFDVVHNTQKESKGHKAGEAKGRKNTTGGRKATIRLDPRAKYGPFSLCSGSGGKWFGVDVVEGKQDKRSAECRPNRQRWVDRWWRSNGGNALQASEQPYLRLGFGGKAQFAICID